MTVSAGGKTATTNSNGDYTVTGLAAGTHTVTPSLGGYTFAPGTLSVTVGPNVTGQNFAATAVTYAISGHVTCAGSPLSGASVSDGGVAQRASLTSAGAYALSGLAAGAIHPHRQQERLQLRPRPRARSPCRRLPPGRTSWARS